MTLRPVTNEDSEALLRLVGDCYAEYEGCVVDLEVEERPLLAPADAYDQFWVLEEDGRVVGSVAMVIHDETRVELKKMYLEAGLRGTGRATRLLAAVLYQAVMMAATEVELWSDTRFERAHRFYEREGFLRTGRTRELNDPSGTTEFHFVRRLGGMPK
ncbi:MAG: GNAT family N-acetyltransferase [Planctomycetota bacterium]